MQKSQKSVQEFMRLFGQEVPSSPGIPPEKILALRVNTLAEEVGEFAMAAGYKLELHAAPDLKAPIITLTRDPDAIPDFLGMVDALVDSQYFLDGTSNAMGVDLEPFFDAVHGANMRKVWTAAQLLSMPPDNKAERVENSIYFLVRRPDGKVMKPPGFRPADLRPVLEEQNCRHQPKATPSLASQPSQATVAARA